MTFKITYIITVIFLIFTIVPVNAQTQFEDKTLSNYNVSTNLSTAFKYYLEDPQEPAPIGIASYGINQMDGKWESSKIVTSGIEGRATINSLDAYNADSINPSSNQQYLNNGMIHGANLQLNAMLYVQTTSGIQVFWLQNTNRFDIEDQQVNSPRDLILNQTSKTNCNPLYEDGGKGSVEPCPPTRYGEIFYTFGNPFKSYHLPVDVSNAIYVKPIIGKGVTIFFYNEPFGNGVFDRVLLPIPNIVNADIVAFPIDPKMPTMSSDVEYVWTGFTGGEKTTFKNMDSYLSLEYMGSDTKLHPFPSLFTFGSETTETANNLQVLSYSSGGHVMIGENNNYFLGQSDNASTAIPEFGPLVSIVTILAIISMIMISKIKLSNLANF